MTGNTYIIGMSALDFTRNTHIGKIRSCTENYIEIQNEKTTIFIFSWTIKKIVINNDNGEHKVFIDYQ